MASKVTKKEKTLADKFKATVKKINTMNIEYVHRPDQIAKAISVVSGYSFKHQFQVFDPTKVKWRANFRKMWDHAEFAEAFGYKGYSSKEEKSSNYTNITLYAGAEIQLQHDRKKIILLENADELHFMHQVFEYYKIYDDFLPESKKPNKERNRFLRVLKLFFEALRTCTYHDTEMERTAIEYIDKKDMFHLYHVLACHWLGFWV